MHCIKVTFLTIAALVLINTISQAQQLHFTVSMNNPETQLFHVELKVSGFTSSETRFSMPVWTPGYYQRLDFARNVKNITANDATGLTIPVAQEDSSTWSISTPKGESVTLSYDVKATRSFVANPFLDSTHGYIVGAGVFVYPEGKLKTPVTVTIQPYHQWKQVATGLDLASDQKIPFTYSAPNFDILYDCPILIGNLDTLPTFTVKGIPHYFVGYKLGHIDAQPFITDLQKMVTTASAIIGDIPYKHYTFIGIGPGMGGIEHLNSTTISFSSNGLDKPEGRIRTLNFIAHEYFHHYNVKRIRPIELGPFDYANGNRTNLLWVSEGLTVYYEYLILKRAGLCTEENVFKALRSNIMAFQTKPGRLHQSLQQASYETWSDGPFGRTGDEANKTISYYDKGPVVGMLFDLAIRHHTGNKKSLDDVMRTLYKVYYQQQKRGFTEAELRKVIEQTAGTKLNELFEYVYTTKEIDYNKYLAYAGLTINLDPAETTAKTANAYTITRLPNPDVLQRQVLESWLGNSPE